MCIYVCTHVFSCVCMFSCVYLCVWAWVWSFTESIHYSIGLHICSCISIALTVLVICLSLVWTFQPPILFLVFRTDFTIQYYVFMVNLWRCHIFQKYLRVHVSFYTLCHCYITILVNFSSSSAIWMKVLLGSSMNEWHSELLQWCSNEIHLCVL